MGEHKERWEGAKAMSMAEAMKAMPEVERKYKLECAAYDNVVFGMSDEFTGAAKLEQEKLSKLADGGELQGLVDNGSYVAIKDGVVVKDASAVTASVTEFDSTRDKSVDTIMATKTSMDRKK